MGNLTLLTDLYQLTMLAGYFESDKHLEPCCFELYFRRCPFGSSYCLAAGLETALEYLSSLEFGPSEIEYLRSLDLFSERFLRWIADFRFHGEVWAVSEGELVFPNEPLLTVKGNLGECQLVESALLNMINFQTLVATKASRVKTAADDGSVLEFGLRRAQGVNGAMSASRAAFIGGCSATSNVLAGSTYGIPVRGTHAHSWVMSFASELEAFRAYAHSYPTTCTLLVDTYDTLSSGVPNAIIVGQELAARGHVLAGIRLDSGDLSQLSRSARKMLDEAGLNSTKIVASNDLDEHQIARLKSEGAPIDVWGVGTNLVTCKDDPALGGVYKLVASGPDLTPRIKLSSNPVKSTIPGIKQVYRFFDKSGEPGGDLLCKTDEPAPPTGVVVGCLGLFDDTTQPGLSGEAVRPLLHRVMRDGSIEGTLPSLTAIQERAAKALAALPSCYKSLGDGPRYPVSLSPTLSRLRAELSTRCRT